MKSEYDANKGFTCAPTMPPRKAKKKPWLTFDKVLISFMLLMLGVCIFEVVNL